jgi:hypothetical protein
MCARGVAQALIQVQARCAAFVGAADKRWKGNQKDRVQQPGHDVS